MFRVQVLAVGRLDNKVACIDYERAEMFTVRCVSTNKWVNDDTGLCVNASSAAEALRLFFYSVNVDKLGRAFPCLPSQCSGSMNGKFAVTMSKFGMVVENKMYGTHPERFVMVDVLGRVENPLVGYHCDRDRGAWFIGVYNKFGLYLGTLTVEDMDDPVFDSIFGLHKEYRYVNSRQIMLWGS